MYRRRVRALLVLAMLAPGTALAQSALRSPPPEPPPLHPPQPQVFLSLAIGSGVGALGGETEALEADVATGVQWAPMHLRAELAAFRNPRLAFAISARLGYTFADTGDPPAAKAILLRVYRMCSPIATSVTAWASTGA